MANRLWSCLTFTNVAAGATVAQAHNLNVNGAGRVPDFGWVDDSSFTPSADATNVTVTNTAASAQTVHVMVVLIHSVFRELGGAIADMTPKPYWLVGGSGGGGGGGSGVSIQRYIATGAEGTDFMVTLTVPQATDLYSVSPANAGVANIVAYDCPDVLAGDRTTTQFRVVTTGALTLDDIIDFMIVER